MTAILVLTLGSWLPITGSAHAGKDVPSKQAEHAPGNAAQAPVTTADVRADRRLQAPMTLTLNTPSVRQFIACLHSATGVAIEAAPHLEDSPLNLGNMTLQNVPAWKVMEVAAGSQIVGGRWERTEEGYRLVGTAVARLPENRVPPRPPAAPRVNVWLVVSGAVLALVAALLGTAQALRYGRARARAAASAAMPASPQQAAQP